MVFYIYPDGDNWRTALSKVDLHDIGGDGRFESAQDALEAVQQLRVQVRSSKSQVLDHDPHTCDCHEVLD